MNLFNEIINAANELISHTSNTDILVFIGQSPNFLSYIVEFERKIIRIPISGRVLINEYTIPTAKQIVSYKLILDELGLTEAILTNQNIILIDHSLSGQSISSFGKILNIIYGIRKYDFMNIVSPEQIKEKKIIKPQLHTINTIGYLIMPSLMNLANEKYPRSSPMYEYYKWENRPDYSEVIDGLKLMEDLVDYYITKTSEQSIILNPIIRIIKV